MGNSETSEDLEEHEASRAGVEYRPLDNPFYHFGLREHLLSFMDVAQLQAFEQVNRACRRDAYKIDNLRWQKRWARSGVDWIDGFSPKFYRQFKGKGQVFRVRDFMLSGTARKKMSWNRGVKFCTSLGFQMTAELNHPTQCEILDNNQWNTIIELSKNSLGDYDSKFFPEMEEKFWSRTPFDPTGVANFTFNGASLEFGAGLLLPQLLFLIRSDEVRFAVRCACIASGLIPRN